MPENKNEDEFECPACNLIECFYRELNLSEEEYKKVKELEDTPEKAIEYLESIRPHEQIKRAWRRCKERTMKEFKVK